MSTEEEKQETVENGGQEDHGMELRRAIEKIAAGVARLSCGPVPVRVDVNDADVDKVVQAILALRRSGAAESSPLLQALGRAPR